MARPHTAGRGPQALSTLMPVVLCLAIGFQILLSIVILVDFLWVWQAPRLHPRDWAHLYEFPLWSVPSVADLFLGVLVMLVCSLGMLRHRTWAAPAYTIWLILSVVFNAFKPHYFIDLFWFPSLWPLIFIGFFYIAQTRWAGSRMSNRAAGDAGEPSLDRLAALASRHRLVATACVILVTLLSTAVFMLLVSLLSLVVPDGLTGLKVAVGVASMYAFAGVTVRSLSARLLFDSVDRADLQIIGGFMLGSSWDVFRMRRATWPFAKLSVSISAVRLQTPFGVYAWDKTDPRLALTRKGFGRLVIGSADGSMPITFVFVPWREKAIAHKLAELGYA